MESYNSGKNLVRKVLAAGLVGIGSTMMVIGGNQAYNSDFLSNDFYNQLAPAGMGLAFAIMGVLGFCKFAKESRQHKDYLAEREKEKSQLSPIQQKYFEWEGPWLQYNGARFPLDFPNAEGTGTLTIDVRNGTDNISMGGSLSIGGSIVTKDGQAFMNGANLEDYVSQFKE
ncbi:hypothetical protein HOK51_00145 [Candidatus Woesearchaeota archaeon]|jgi:hypothetical protein|nr:hypothetical protein [Candidatus Woesearchaeota archaeon]MBT6518222.1 hypothetical protein [Candidatus Woesearchaeota archaeon]MBT7368509.1 hypothetical protein [Candidatus Woesearchaeota archaeon]